MPVGDRPTQERNKIAEGNLYVCRNFDPNKHTHYKSMQIRYVNPWKRELKDTLIPIRTTKVCMYDMHETDPQCYGCPREKGYKGVT